MAHKPHQDAGLQMKNKRVFVTHHYPDTDAWLCLWLMYSELLTSNGDARIAFVRSGERLTNEEFNQYKKEGYWVEYVDTGLGTFDQHGKNLATSSSFELLVTKLKLHTRSDIAILVALANATDNVEKVDQTSIHYFFKSLPAAYRDKKTRDIDWGSVWEIVQITLDSMTAQWRAHAERAAKFDASCIKIASSGKKVAILFGKPSQREVAFEFGADVVCFTQPVKGGFNFVAQVSRDARAQEISLAPAIAEIRKAEAEQRGVVVNGFDYTAVGKVSGIPGWHLHDSLKMLSCGTRSHPLGPQEMSQLKLEAIAELILAHV